MMSFVELLTVCAILPICLAGQGAPERHSLYYVYTALSKAVNAPGIFEFTAMGLLDDRKIDYYNSKKQVKIPQQDWMKKKLPADYWEKGTQSRKSKEQWFKVNVNILMERMKQNGSDVHVLMWKHGCEVDTMADGSFKFYRGVDAYSYDGKDFLSFDDASMQWVAPTPQAVPTKQKWDGVPILNQYTKGYLEKECVDWLGKFRKYGDEELRKQTQDSPPDVRLFAKGTTSPDTFELTCMATGFLPKEIDITVLKGKNVIKKGESVDVLPNGDGTHQTRVSVHAKKSEINDYGCVVNHRTLTKGPIIRNWELDGELCPDGTTTFKHGTIVGVVIVLVMVIPLAIGVFIACRNGVIVFEKGRLKYNGFGTRPPPPPQHPPPPQPAVNKPLLATAPVAIQVDRQPAEDGDEQQKLLAQKELSDSDSVSGNSSEGSPRSSAENISADAPAVIQMEPKPAQPSDSDSGQGTSSSDGSSKNSTEDLNQNVKEGGNADSGKGSPEGSTNSAEK
ncbi:class I histocompatibility antigen, F10 alpha chain-like isoform X2 [Alosa sapidissima]|uniref:class I histocompatibility antigen, F10 alpha chain-like isoform X2 n=1 Tax=Alosa sapidissima TaxID=34773 RepID=UPI001C09DA25|nr:class I histocompatibility antigen, F10 alpha chain-like isoform X2 [Alosa sapidissima]